MFKITFKPRNNRGNVRKPTILEFLISDENIRKPSDLSISHENIEEKINALNIQGKKLKITTLLDFKIFKKKKKKHLTFKRRNNRRNLKKKFSNNIVKCTFNNI